MSIPEPGPAMDAVVAAMSEAIATSGWGVAHFQVIYPEGAWHFSYTVGLEVSYNHPELMVCGLSSSLADKLLAAAAANVVRGRVFSNWDICDTVVIDYSVYFRVFDPMTSTRTISVAREMRPDSRGLQIIIPDAERRFPWDENCNENFAGQLAGMRYIEERRN